MIIQMHTLDSSQSSKEGKIMKKYGIVLVVCCLVLVTAASVALSQKIAPDPHGYVSTADRASAAASGRAQLEAEKQQFISEMASNAANGIQTAEVEDDESDDLGLREKYESFQAEERIKDERDLKACKVLNRLAGTNYQTLAQDKETEYKMLREMVAVMDKPMSTSDRDLLYAYMERRIYWIDDDQSLKLAIQTALRPYGYVDPYATTDDRDAVDSNGSMIYPFP